MMGKLQCKGITVLGTLQCKGITVLGTFQCKGNYSVREITVMGKLH